MEKLIVKNFLTLKQIELGLNKINIAIGPQAEGKSLIAMLLFYFKDFPNKFAISILNGFNKKRLDNLLIDKFIEIFPKYLWSDTKFEIIYHFNDKQIRFSNEKLKTKTKLRIQYSQSILNQFIRLKKEYSKTFSKFSLSQIADKEENLKNQIEKKVDYFFYGADFRREVALFIPAGRSFYSYLKKNIWSFLPSEIKIDYFLKKFGSQYDTFKDIYMKISRDKKSDFYKAIEQIRKIIKGQFLTKEQDVWLHSTALDRGIWASDISSGQQEILPMVVVMSVFAQVSTVKFPVFFFVEEPEAHLFPDTQKLIVELFSFFYNHSDRNIGFFITTHSPYILTAFNNLIQAENALNSISNKPNKDILERKLFKLVPRNEMVSFEDINAFYVENGRTYKLADRENKIIDANKIDEISNELNRTFNDILEIQFPDN